MLRTVTLGFFILNIIFLGALALSYIYAASRMKSRIIYSLAFLFVVLCLTEIIGACAFIKISYIVTCIAKGLSIIAASIFLYYSFKKQKVLKNELHG